MSVWRSWDHTSLRGGHLKSYLQVRPVFHRKPERVINHVRLCFLAYWISARLARQWRLCGEIGEVHWRTFLSSLRERGIGIPDLVTSDAHEGLKSALKATLNASPWQRCQFHLQQNAQACIPKVSMRQQVADDIRYIYNSRNRPEADMRLNEIVEKYSQSAPDLARWMESAIPEGLTIFAFPENIRRRLRTSNMCETLNTQIKRRTRVAGLFPNEASILRLVSAILMDISEEWESSKTYLPQISNN